jgi:hypothetical protein
LSTTAEASDGDAVALPAGVSFSGVTGPGVVADPSREAELQLTMLSERFGLRVNSADSGARRLLLSSEVKSGVDASTKRSGCNCIWIALSVFRTNCCRDMRVASSATCRSVLRRSIE